MLCCKIITIRSLYKKLIQKYMISIFKNYIKKCCDTFFIEIEINLEKDRNNLNELNNEKKKKVLEKYILI